MTCATGVKTSVTTNSPFQDFFQPYDQLQSRFPLSLEPLPNLFFQLRALELNFFDPTFLSSVIGLILSHNHLDQSTATLLLQVRHGLFPALWAGSKDSFSSTWYKITYLLNPELPHNNIMYTGIDVVPGINFVVPKNGLNIWKLV